MRAVNLSMSMLISLACTEAIVSEDAGLQPIDAMTLRDTGSSPSIDAGEPSDSGSTHRSGSQEKQGTN